MKLYIPLHSFSGLITNSSSETFIFVQDSAEKAVKDLVNSILKAVGSDKVCADLFEIKMVYRITENNYSGGKFKEINHEFDSEEDFETWRESNEDADLNYNEDLGIGCYRSLSVTAKDPNCKDAARILNAIENLVDGESYYN